jgi:HTH-type transcriptional regulator / antitoxin HipB
MANLNRFIENQKSKDPKFADGFDEGYVHFKIGVMLKTARERAGFTQEQIAKKLRTNKSAISRIENHAEDIRLSTLSRYAKALGKKLKLEIN